MNVASWMGIIAAFSAVVGFLLNMLVIVVRFVKRKTITTFQFLLATIAFNDMVLSLLFGFMSALMLNNFIWIYHPSACRILFPMVTNFMSVNVGCMFTVSYERYRAIMNPFKPRISMKRTIVAISLIWMLSTAFAIPNVVALHIQPDGECRESWNNDISPQIYSSCLLITFYVLPLASMIVMHIIIGLKLRRARNRFGRHERASRSRQNMKNNVQAMKLLLSITIAFSIFVLPTKLYYLVWDLAPGLITDDVAVFLSGYKSLYYIHVIVNPILYSLTSSKFRKDLKEVIIRQKLAGAHELLAMNIYDNFRS